MSPEEQEHLMEKEYGITLLVMAGHGIAVLLRSIEILIIAPYSPGQWYSIRFSGRHQQKGSCVDLAAFAIIVANSSP